MRRNHYFIVIYAVMLNLCVTAGIYAATPAGSPTAFIQTKVENIPISYIAVRLNDARVEVSIEVAHNFPHGDESFSLMMQRLQPIAAINGAYFSTRYKAPIGDIVSDGAVLHRGNVGSVLSIDQNDVPAIRRVLSGYSADWRGYKSVIGCGPLLVLDGKIDVRPSDEGFRDPHIMGQSPRMAIGYTSDNHLLLVRMTSNLSFLREARVMKALGCTNAMNLDAGASTAMYYQGRYIAKPGRALTNIITIRPRRTPSEWQLTSIREREVLDKLPQSLPPATQVNLNELAGKNLVDYEAILGQPYDVRTFTGVTYAAYDMRYYRVPGLNSITLTRYVQRSGYDWQKQPRVPSPIVSEISCSFPPDGPVQNCRDALASLGFSTKTLHRLTDTIYDGSRIYVDVPHVYTVAWWQGTGSFGPNQDDNSMAKAGGHIRIVVKDFGR